MKNITTFITEATKSTEIINTFNKKSNIQIKLSKSFNDINEDDEVYEDWYKQKIMTLPIYTCKLQKTTIESIIDDNYVIQHLPRDYDREELTESKIKKMINVIINYISKDFSIIISENGNFCIGSTDFTGYFYYDENKKIHVHDSYQQTFNKNTIPNINKIQEIDLLKILTKADRDIEWLIRLYYDNV